jgi:hypothetical protein
VRNPFYQSAFSEEDARITASTDPNDESPTLQDASMHGLQWRGVRFLSCHRVGSSSPTCRRTVEGLRQDGVDIASIAFVIAMASATV